MATEHATRDESYTIIVQHPDDGVWAAYVLDAPVYIGAVCDTRLAALHRVLDSLRGLFEQQERPAPPPPTSKA